MMQAADRLVFLVAGQSNALNWHADAALLPPDSRDSSVPFYFVEGAPPSRAKGPVAFNSTSDGKWQTLAPQVQKPFVRYHERFFGPEISAARTLLEGGTQDIAIVKTVFFGSDLASQWNPDATTGDRLYAVMKETMDAALRQLKEKGDNPILSGVFWMQGEADANRPEQAAAYGANLKGLVLRIRQDFAVPDLPFIIGRIAPIKKYAALETVRSAQVDVATSVSHMAWVDVDDLGRDSDDVHLLAPGVITLGQRFAKAWLSLQKSVPAPSP